MRSCRKLNSTAMMKEQRPLAGLAERIKTKVTRPIAFLSLFLIPFSLFFCSCGETSFKNPVPRYPVRVTIDTRTGAYVHFVPTAINTYVIVDRNGYHYNGNTYPLNATDMYGYAGVLVYINCFGQYDAYDLCCPNCASLCVPCEIDGMFAVCPHCGEQYDLASGTAAPQNGIAHDYMLRLNIINADGRLNISQKQ